MKIIKNKEAEFHDFFLNNSNLVLKGCQIIAHEFSLRDALSILKTNTFNEDISSGKVIGRIDFIFKYKQTIYISEVKYYPYKDNEFWDALKIVGYYEYYKFQTGIRAGLKPAIIMPYEKIRLEHQHIASVLGIRLFGIIAQIGIFKLKTLEEDKPYWKQLKEND